MAALATTSTPEKMEHSFQQVFFLQDARSCFNKTPNGKLPDDKAQTVFRSYGAPQTRPHTTAGKSLPTARRIRLDFPFFHPKNHSPDQYNLS